MLLRKHLFMLLATLLVVFLGKNAYSRTVYVISNTDDGVIRAYEVQGNSLVYQAHYDSDIIYSIGLAIDPNAEFLFVTHEDFEPVQGNWIEIVDAKQMKYVNTVTALGATDLAGITMDTSNSKIYVVDRYTNHLYSNSWNAAAKTLTPDFVDPYYIALEGIVTGSGRGAFGIALDEENGLLYVTDNTDSIKYYDTNDWSKEGEVNNVSCNVISVAIDVDNQFLYYGSMGAYGEGDPCLYQYNLSSSLEQSVNVGCSVAGIAVDQATGLIYLTTYGGAYDTNEPYPKDRLMVYDSSLQQLWYSDDIGNPAGVAVAGNVSYKPPFPLLEFVKDDNDIVCASPLISEAEYEFMGSPYNWLYYNIHYNANGHADTNVYITDHLPAEVNFISCDPNDGVYDPIKRTVTWYIPVMSASDSNTYRIQVGVNYYAKPGHKIINLCEIESDLYYMFTTLETDVCCYGGDIIYVDSDANDPNSYHNGTSWLDAYIDLQEALHTARVCGREQICVAQQTYKPTDINDISARSISFELVDNVTLYGGFPPGGGTWPQRNPNVYVTILSGDIAEPDYHSDNSYHVVKCEDVNNAVLDGFIITAGKANGLDANESGGGIYCKDSYDLIIRNCSISINSAKYGGGMYNELSSANIANCIFFENEATYGDGGGIYNCYEASPTIINCTFSGNSATTTVCNTYGGAMYNTNSSEPNITNCTFSDNSASEGGAVYNYDHSDPNISNCVFNDNTADSYGGGMVNSYQSSPKIINCTFSGNSATTVGSSYGGAICNWNNSDPNITYCMFIDNSAHEGGSVYNYYSAPNIANCIFTANDANMGGGLFNTSSSPNMTNCVIVGNTADSYGGGMYNYYESYPAVVNSIFSGNRADICGGGIFNCYNYNNSVELNNCTVSGNWACDGGGIYCWYFANTNLTNCIFWGNVADVEDEIYNDSNTCSLNVNYSDVKGGWSGGVGNIDKDPCFFSVEPSTGNWMESASYDSLTFQSTLYDSGADWSVNGLAGKFVNPDTSQALQFFIVSNNANTIKVWSDVRPIAHYGDTYQIYDYHLKLNSACIDTGDPNFNPDPNMTDIDGEPRIFDGDDNGTETVDMGADEYYWSPADFNSDGIVNFFDYALFASAWQTTPADQNYNDVYDLVDNNCIDSNDLACFCEDWLWQTSWAKAFPCDYGQTMGLGMGRSMSESLGLTEDLFTYEPDKQAQQQLTEADIEEILKWLEDLWLTDEEVRKIIPEDEWLKFLEDVIQAAKEQIQDFEY